jgi:hypothetical protein
MQIKSPIAVFNEYQKRKMEKEEVLDIFKERLRAFFSKQGTSEMLLLTKRQQEVGISRKVLHDLTVTASNGIKAFKRQELGIIHRYNAKTFADIQGRTPFTKLLVVIRDFCGEDIKNEMSCDDAMDMTIDHFLFYEEKHT